MNRNRLEAQRGFSLLELAVVLVVLGVVAILLVQFLGTASQERQEIAKRNLLTRADDALLAYAMVNSRLPCPASNGSGLEDCAAGQVGKLPFKTIGLPDASARRIRYGVLRRPGSRTRDAELTQSWDRHYPIYVLPGSDTATEWPLGKANGLDLCLAVRNGQQVPIDSGFLHITRTDAPDTIAANIAYALALPRGADGFTSHQANNRPAFDSPLRPSSTEFHDRVVAVGLDQLWSRMRCGDHLAATGHAHFNGSATIAVMHKALKDYKTQLEISKKMAEANVENGKAALLSGGAGIADAAGGVADTVSEALASNGAMAFKVALGAIATAAAVAVTITAGVMKSKADQALTDASKAHRDVDPLITRAAELDTSVRKHAVAADAAGLY